MRVGFVGIGNMGRPMAVNVLKAGHAVVALDSEPARAERLALEHGASAAQRPEELGSVEFVITMLPTGQIVRDLYLRDGLASALRPGTVCIDMSSSDPAGTRALGAELRGIGLILLDAPVSGAVPRAQSGTLTIMIGGDDASAIERAKPLLAAMGNRLFEAGSLGCGHALKALNNLVAAAAFTATAEALLIGKRFGLDPARMIEVMNVSTARNFHTDVVMSEHVIGGKFATGFALGLLAKDVQIAADLARQVRLDAPLSRLVNARWAHARDRLGPQRDNSEAILSWDESLSE
jgi:3-hydroxyisobutyrate dehydrogenase